MLNVLGGFMASLLSIFTMGKDKNFQKSAICELTQKFPNGIITNGTLMTDGSVEHHTE